MLARNFAGGASSESDYLNATLASFKIQNSLKNSADQSGFTLLDMAGGFFGDHIGEVLPPISAGNDSRYVDAYLHTKKVDKLAKNEGNKETTKNYWEQRYSRERFAQHKSLRSIALDCRCIITDDEFHTTLKDMLGLPEEYYARHTDPVAMWNGLTKSLDRPIEIILLNSHVLLENLVDGPLVLDVLRTASAEGYIKLSER